MVRLSAVARVQITRIATPASQELGRDVEHKTKDFFREACNPFPLSLHAFLLPLAQYSTTKIVSHVTFLRSVERGVRMATGLAHVALGVDQVPAGRVDNGERASKGGGEALQRQLVCAGPAGAVSAPLWLFKTCCFLAVLALPCAMCVTLCVARKLSAWVSAWLVNCAYKFGASLCSYSGMLRRPLTCSFSRGRRSWT